jgi:hypothetical protein
MGEIVEPRREFIAGDLLASTGVLSVGEEFWKKAIPYGKKAITRWVKAITASATTSDGIEKQLWSV